MITSNDPSGNSQTSRIIFKGNSMDLPAQNQSTSSPASHENDQNSELSVKIVEAVEEKRPVPWITNSDMYIARIDDVETLEAQLHVAIKTLRDRVKHLSDTDTSGLVQLVFGLDIVLEIFQHLSACYETRFRSLSGLQAEAGSIHSRHIDHRSYLDSCAQQHRQIDEVGMFLAAVCHVPLEVIRINQEKLLSLCREYLQQFQELSNVKVSREQIFDVQSQSALLSKLADQIVQVIHKVDLIENSINHAELIANAWYTNADSRAIEALEEKKLSVDKQIQDGQDVFLKDIKNRARLITEIVQAVLRSFTDTAS